METKDTKQTIKPMVINGHINAVYPALVLLAGMELELFSFLGDANKMAEELATEMSISVSKLRPLLYALVAAGLLELDGEKFSNTEESGEFLVKGKPRYFGDSHSTYHDLWESTLLTAKSIKIGKPQAKHDFSAMSSEELEGFIMGLDSGAAATARRLHKTYDFSRFYSILDGGGGSGGLAVELAKLCSESTATIIDLPNVASIARRRVLSSGLGKRINVIEDDLTKLKGHNDIYDAVVLRSLIQVLAPDEADSVIKNMSKILRRFGEAFVVGRVLEDNRLGPLEAVAANVMFLNVYDSGQAYTVSEYERWFERHGLMLNDKKSLAGGYMMIQFIKS